MAKYKVYQKNIEYRCIVVEADSEDEAIKKSEQADWNDFEMCDTDDYFEFDSITKL